MMQNAIKNNNKTFSYIDQETVVTKQFLSWRNIFFLSLPEDFFLSAQKKKKKKKKKKNKNKKTSHIPIGKKLPPSCFKYCIFYKISD